MKELEATVGGLSRPSKMPGLAYGIPASDCLIGAILRKQKGTVCSECYAFKGMYVFPNVKNAQRRRITLLRSDLGKWTEHMIMLLERKYSRKKGDDRVFRWHDAGDVQSPEHFAAIVKIAEALPDIRFWIPTKEFGMIRDWVQSQRLKKKKFFPANLTVRISASLIGQTIFSRIPGTVVSTVDSGQGHSCPAPSQGGECGPCRACWDKNVKSVDYHES